jgi:molecular chaperone DnaK
LQGEREIAAHNKSLGQFELVGLPPAPRGTPQIEVSFDIDSNGIVSAQARDVATQREQKILVTPSSGLTEEEISAIIEDAHEHQEEDRRRAEYIRAKARLEGLVDSNQKTFNEFGSMLDEERQGQVRRTLADAKHALDSGSASECTEALEKIAQMGRILSEVILYDPGAFSAQKSEVDSPEEA